MLNRIKRAWKLSKIKEPIVFDGSKLTVDEKAVLTSAPAEKIIPIEPIGDGKAVFIGEPTPEEELDFKREQEGTLPWYKRILSDE